MKYAWRAAVGGLSVQLRSGAGVEGEHLELNPAQRGGAEGMLKEHRRGPASPATVPAPLADQDPEVTAVTDLVQPVEHNLPEAFTGPRIGNHRIQPVTGSPGPPRLGREEPGGDLGQAQRVFNAAQLAGRVH